MAWTILKNFEQTVFKFFEYFEGKHFKGDLPMHSAGFRGLFYGAGMGRGLNGRFKTCSTDKRGIERMDTDEENGQTWKSKFTKDIMPIEKETCAKR